MDYKNSSKTTYTNILRSEGKNTLTFMFTADFLSSGQKLKSKQSCITPITYAKLTWEFLSMYILHTTKEWQDSY